MRTFLRITFKQKLSVHDLVVALAVLKNDYPSVASHSEKDVYDWLRFELVEKGKRFGGSGLDSNMYLREKISDEYRKELATELLEKKIINQKQFEEHLTEWDIQI